MRQLFVTVISLVMLLPTVTAEPKQAWQAPLASKSLLLDIALTPGDKLVAVGDRGHILLSTDGQNWQQAQVPVTSMLTSVFFIDANTGWAVGHDATILKTEDAGQSWQVQQYLPEVEKPLLDVVFKNADKGMAIGAYGQVYRTEDGGQNWQYEFHGELLPVEDVEYLEELKLEDEALYLDERGSILPHFNRVETDGRTLYLAGELGLMAKSNDFGKTWQAFDEIYQGSFFDIVRTQAGNLVVVGLRGHVFRSLRNGTPWQMSKTDTTALLNDVVLVDDNRLLVLGNSGTLLVSDDDGQSFVEHRQADGKSLVAGVWFQNKLIAVSDVGIKTITIDK